MGYLIIFNVVAAAQFVGPGCTGLFQPSNSYYRGEPRGDDEGIFVGRGKERQPTSPSHAKKICQRHSSPRNVRMHAAHCRAVSHSPLSHTHVRPIQITADKMPERPSASGRGRPVKSPFIEDESRARQRTRHEIRMNPY